MITYRLVHMSVPYHVRIDDRDELEGALVRLGDDGVLRIVAKPILPSTEENQDK